MTNSKNNKPFYLHCRKNTEACINDTYLNADRAKSTFPRRLTPLSIAAFFCCILISGGIALYQLADSESAPVFLPSDPAMDEDSMLLNSSIYEYADAFTVDIPYSSSDQPNGLTAQEEGLIQYYTLITESSVSSPSTSQSASADITHCNNNLYTMDGAYWILTDTGLKQLELTNLHTTVDLYGTWEIDLDYAIVDGKLVFHNNVSTESYAIYNGEILTASEYHDGGMSAVYGQLEWVNPSVAYALPIEDSSDTVLLQVYREDNSSEEKCAYTFLYNILTGEIQDPLANIPELFDHGSFCNATYNDSFTYAIVKTLEDGTMHSYICDLIHGTMTSLLDIASGCIPEFDNPNSVSDIQSTCYWSGENNLLFYVVEQIPNETDGSHLDNGAYNTGFDYCYYLTSYNLTTNTWNYQVNLGQVEPVDNDLSGVYLHFWNTERNLFRFIDTETGLFYDFNIDLTEYSMYTGEAIVLFWNNTQFYLLDEASPGWTILDDDLVPRTPDTWVRLLTDAWILLTEDEQAELIQIPKDLSLTLLSPSGS